ALWKEPLPVSPESARPPRAEPDAGETAAPAVASPEAVSETAAVVQESVAAPAIAPELAAAPVDEAERWKAVAEDVRMQGLQRIDIFTDTGLKEQLNQRLQPIVDRASADLVTAINQHVGQLLRAYVAEAIEREIEKWREGKG